MNKINLYNFSSIVQYSSNKYHGTTGKNIYVLFLGNLLHIDDAQKRKTREASLSKKQSRCFQTISPLEGLNQATMIREHIALGTARHLPRGSTRVMPVEFTFGGNLCFRQRRKTARTARTATPWGNSTRGRRETRGNPRAWEKSAKV